MYIFIIFNKVVEIHKFEDRLNILEVMPEILFQEG